MPLLFCVGSPMLCGRLHPYARPDRSSSVPRGRQTVGEQEATMTQTLDGTSGGLRESRPPGDMAQPQPHEAVWALATAAFAARCLHVVADLGVADHIDDHAVPVSDLAARCG